MHYNDLYLKLDALWDKRQQPVREWFDELLEVERLIVSCCPLSSNSMSFDSHSKEGEQFPWDLLYAHVALLKGVAQLYQANYHEAHSYYATARNIYESAADPYWYGRLLYMSGITYATTGSLQQTLTELTEALSLAKAFDYQDLICSALFNIGVLYMTNLHKPNEAMAIFEEGIVISKQFLNSDRSKGNYKLATLLYSQMLTGLCRSAIECERLEDLEGYTEKAIAACEISEDQRMMGWCYETASQAYLVLNKLDDAKNYATKFMQVSIQRGERYQIGNAYLNLARISFSNSDFTNVLEYAHMARETFEEIEGHSTLDEVYLLLTKSYEELKDFESSLMYFKLYNNLVNERNTKEMETQINQFTAKLQIETVKRDAEIYRLKHIELANALEELKNAQGDLIKYEKISAIIGVISSIAHEINTPLGNALMLTSLFNTQFLNPYSKGNNGSDLPQNIAMDLDDMREIIAQLEHNLFKASEIVRQFNQHAINPKLVNKSKLTIKRLVDEIQQQQKVKEYLNDHDRLIEGIQIDVVDDVEFSGDISSLTLMLSGLIDNAYYHAYNQEYPLPQGSCWSKVSFETFGDKMVISIEDWGCGISAQMKNSLFQPFAKGFGQKSKSTGLGLGLYFAYSVAVLVHGGDITVTTKPEREAGTMIKVVLNAG